MDLARDWGLMARKWIGDRQSRPGTQWYRLRALTTSHNAAWSEDELLKGKKRFKCLEVFKGNSVLLFGSQTGPTCYKISCRHHHKTWFYFLTNPWASHGITSRRSSFQLGSSVSLACSSVAGSTSVKFVCARHLHVELLSSHMGWDALCAPCTARIYTC